MRRAQGNSTSSLQVEWGLAVLQPTTCRGVPRLSTVSACLDVPTGAPAPSPCSLACHPEKPEVACGFRGGVVRIFDAASAVLLQESRQHTGAMTQLAFACNGRVLLSLGEWGRAGVCL